MTTEEKRFRIFVSYNPLPALAELKKLLPEEAISEWFSEDDFRLWERHNSCERVDETPGERDFWIADVPKEFSEQADDERMEWSWLSSYYEKLGFRFAVVGELIEFAVTCPSTAWVEHVTALGSSFIHGTYCYVASIGENGDGRYLVDEWSEEVGVESVLLVRMTDADLALRIGAAPSMHYRMQLGYEPLPGIGELESALLRLSEDSFDEDNPVVSPAFDGCRWERHSSCSAVDTTPGERVLRLAKLPEVFHGQSIQQAWNELAAHFDREGYRFAIETEAFEFIKKRSTLLHHYRRILTLGSSVEVDPSTYSHGVGGIHVMELSFFPDPTPPARMYSVAISSEMYESKLDEMDRLLLVRN
ncbi:hypothetical protein IPH19_02810 [Candidatus Uhrbacteria bacterium]|nr:MAG: hypothetical protein IPH19_02810 [Candidatus Uhrbacteria bacterium]